MALWRGTRMIQAKASLRRAFTSKAEVGVFWDLNRCGVGDAQVDDSVEDGTETDAFYVAPNIVHMLRYSGFSGPISIRAYGNTRSFSNHRVTEALVSTGVDLHHISGGMKYLCKHLILDMLLWIRENPPPAHMLLISGDKELANVLHKLRMRGYDVLLAHPEGDLPRELASAATQVWTWDGLAKGTGLPSPSVKHKEAPHLQSPECNNLQQFNRLQDSGKPICCPSENIEPAMGIKGDFPCHDLSSNQQNIPEEVVKQVLDIIRTRPSGFTVKAFRRQLNRLNIVLDKNFYGHQDLLSFLLSIPNLNARLVWTSDKTRNFLFTEDLTRSRNFDNSNDMKVSDISYNGKDAKHENNETEEVNENSDVKMNSISCIQQSDNISPSRELMKEDNVTMKLGFSDASKPDKRAGLLSSAPSTVWRKIIFKLSSMSNFR
ncbi:hypothetical protein KP509_17G027300 [Ceratopteris richardii]|uniref:NYN domain-containing protein n=1 Tax=Ceratopteris richardii TaxID=49495 RepID=A0A8T2SSZ5_CERRI|nr:hypothetical protein KP509_17G027300 [Ceratopteris richardii]